MKKLLYFTAGWCGPCKMMAPIFETFRQKSNIQTEKIDVDSNQQMTDKYQVSSIPTFILLDENGNISKRVTGAQSLQSLENLIK
jgi:thioredoxin